MAKRIKADNDTWQAALDTSPGYGRTLVFFCVSNDQRPWRVVRLDEDELGGPDEVGGPDDLEALSSDDLRALFERSESMNVSPA